MSIKDIVMIALAGSIYISATGIAKADNTIIRDCQVKHNYNGLNETKTWSNIATCIVTEKNKIRFAEEDRLWAFVKANPHYRYPGSALPNGKILPLDPGHFSSKKW
jgi:hypothetical protein